MHLIPATSSHWHILISVFPSVGLIFLIGFYIVGMAVDNEGLKRLGLLGFVALAVLGIPTYISGVDSMAALAPRPDISQGRMDTHLGWAWAALVMLGITGIVAAIDLWLFRRKERVSRDALHLVLGLSLVTLILMVVVGELGWEIGHHELQMATVAFQTPVTWAHVHIILNHFPTVGFVVTLTFFGFGLAMKNTPMIHASLVAFVVCAILGVPTYVTGAGAMWSLTDPPMEGISKALINSHRDMALLALFGMAFTGGTAWMVVWRYRYIPRFSSGALYTVLVFALITLALMAETGHRGGLINHPEIRAAAGALPTDPNAGWSPAIESLINNVIWFVPWQTVHFFGYSLVFATVLAVALRVLGFWKSVPFSAVHRLLPLGVFGVMMNVFSGMLMLLADTYRYINEITFIPKMILLPIGAMAVLYYSLSDKLWDVKAGDDAPMFAKWVAVFVLLSWTGVIMGGRLLPYV